MWMSALPIWSDKDIGKCCAGLEPTPSGARLKPTLATLSRPLHSSSAIADMGLHLAGSNTDKIMMALREELVYRLCQQL